MYRTSPCRTPSAFPYNGSPGGWGAKCSLPTCQRPKLRYWTLPDGRAVAWSLLQLVDKKVDELLDANANEAYHAIGQVLGYLPLDMLPDAERGA